MQVRCGAYRLVRNRSPLFIVYFRALLRMFSAADRSSERMWCSLRKSRRGLRQSGGTSRSVCMAGILFTVMLGLLRISIWMMRSLSSMMPARYTRASECLFLPWWMCSMLIFRNLLSLCFISLFY
ncbi:hypothetical protein GIB67_029930 [Kingdonia uniflora]|uniref:Uncharacterized protein n=1 Tax=Kingdonia uniflora TaxID=39325 RepID=A0A7J7MY25_9MAGN|nr:hypothetical protein GIB67_029930 [Kingdonia uniflora]